MKNFILIILLVFVSCSPDITDENPIQKTESSFTNLSSVYKWNKKKSINQEMLVINHKILDSIVKKELKNWEDYLKVAMENKTLININEQGLFLKNYKLKEEISLNNFFEKYPDFNNYNTIYQSSNGFSNDFTIVNLTNAPKDKRRIFNEIAIDRINYMLNFEGDNNKIKVIKLNWSYNGKDLNTIAVFTDKKLIYDPILSNLRQIKTSIDRNSNQTRSSYYYDCYGENKIIDLYDNIYLDNRGAYGSGAYAMARIHLTGQLNTYTCTKYLYNYSDLSVTDATTGWSADSEVGIKTFVPANQGTNGYIQYELGVVVSSYCPFQSVSATFNGSQITFNTACGAQTKTKGAYKTAANLN